MAFVRGLRRLVDLLIDGAALLGAAGILVALAAVSGDVVGRAFGRPLYGARDVVQMAGIFVVFGGMAYAHRAGGHVSVDLFAPRFPRRLNRVLVILGNVAGAVIFTMIAWQLWKAIGLARMLNQSTNLLIIPRAPFLGAMVAFSAITVASMVVRILELAFDAKADAEGRR